MSYETLVHGVNIDPGVAIQLDDNIALFLGTDLDVKFYSDGTDLFLDLQNVGSGGWMIAGAGSFPSPDAGVGSAVHIWHGTAGSVGGSSGSSLIIEHSTTHVINMLGPDAANMGIRIGSPTDGNDRAHIMYLGGSDAWRFRIDQTNRLLWSPGAFALQEATIISTSTGELTISGNDRTAFTTKLLMRDNVSLVLGTTSDAVLRLKSLTLAADEELVGVIVGTGSGSNHQGTAANSLVISNVTADGDIMMLVQTGGDSLEAFFADADVGLTLGHGLPAVTVPVPISLTGVMNIGAAGTLTISSGAVAITGPRHTLVVEGGAGSGADILATATGGVDGDLLILEITTTGASDEVTVQNGTGSDTFILAGGLDFVMDNVDDIIEFLHNGTEWVERSRSSNS